jgi:hypothetical protein
MIIIVPPPADGSQASDGFRENCTEKPGRVILPGFSGDVAALPSQLVVELAIVTYVPEPAEHAGRQRAADVSGQFFVILVKRPAADAAGR